MGKIFSRWGAPKNETMEVIAGLLLVMFVAVMSLTIVGTALPVMLSSLHGSETQYAWVVTSMLLSSTAASHTHRRQTRRFIRQKETADFLYCHFRPRIVASWSLGDGGHANPDANRPRCRPRGTNGHGANRHGSDHLAAREG